MMMTSVVPKVETITSAATQCPPPENIFFCHIKVEKPGGLGEFIHGKHVEIRHIHQHVDRGHGQHAAQQRERDVALRLLHITRDVSEFFPPVVSPERAL